MNIADAETPRLLLDPERLRRNICAMAGRCADLGVALRPHLKTPKSLRVAQEAVPDDAAPITVSTLKEAAYFADGGYTDILCAAVTTPVKLAHADRIRRDTGTDTLLVTDNVDLVREAEARAKDLDTSFRFLIEIDCGEHRSGVPPASPELLAIADALNEANTLSLAGVMTHAGHSYGFGKPDEIAQVAEDERTAAANSADALRAAGHTCDIVSAGSSPTVLHARHLDGITEARAGVYLFWDLAQYSRGNCGLGDIAVTVLASVIGHNRQAGTIVLDAGGLALSKDISANTALPDVKYGYICDARTLEPYDGLSVENAYQEHGIVPVPDVAWFDKLPIGAQVRVMPNHTCMTCAAYDAYDIVQDDEIVDTWTRVNGW